MDQTPQGKSPEIFAPGIISTEFHEFSCTFTPDGKEFYFTRRVPEFNRNRIMVTRLEKDGWTESVIAPKAGDYESIEPYITPDGKKFFFQTWRPVEGETTPAFDIWVMNNNGSGWEEPIHLDHPFNPMKAMYFSMSEEGRLYTTDISGGMGTGKIVYTTFEDGRYTDFKEISSVINATGKEIYPCIALDESFILFTKRADGDESGIYISFRKSETMWSEPIKLELGLNRVSMPRLSPDGKYLFFTGLKERLKGDIYWMNASFIEELRPDENAK